MLVKLCGCAALIAGCALIGAGKASSLSQRVKALMGLEQALLIFEGEIEYKLSPLCDACAAAAHSDISGVFKGSLADMPRLGAAKAFEGSVSSCSLEKDEAAALSAFAAGMTSPDKLGQLQNARLCRERIKGVLKTAQEKKQQLYKLYSASGALLGAAVAILFF